MKIHIILSYHKKYEMYYSIRKCKEIIRKNCNKSDRKFNFSTGKLIIASSI